MICGTVCLIVGFIMLQQSIKARKNNSRSSALLWMVGSAVLAAFGVIQFLAMCTGS